MATKIRHTKEAAKKFLNYCMEKAGVDRGCALAYRLEVEPSVISRIKNAKGNVGPAMLLKLHEQYGCSVAEMKQILEGKEDGQ